MVASLEERLGRNLWCAGRPQESAEPIEHTLTLARTLQSPQDLLQSPWSSKGYLYTLCQGGCRRRWSTLGRSRGGGRSSGFGRVGMGAGNVLADLCVTSQPRGSRGTAGRAGLGTASPGAGGPKTSGVTLIYALMMAGRFENLVRAALAERTAAATAGTCPDRSAVGPGWGAGALGTPESTWLSAGSCQSETGHFKQSQNWSTCEAAISLEERRSSSSA